MHFTAGNSHKHKLDAFNCGLLHSALVYNKLDIEFSILNLHSMALVMPTNTLQAKRVVVHPDMGCTPSAYINYLPSPSYQKMSGKLIVITAPSGAGKTTIARHLLESYPMLEFSVSATTRMRRPDEVHGKDYYFLTAEQFQQRISNKSFVEWEEVYKGVYYGTLRDEIESIWKTGKDVLFDVDVKGAINLKKQYGDKALTLFIKPPSVEILAERLRSRATETQDRIDERIAKAQAELQFEGYFDETIVNDSLPEALQQAMLITDRFLFS